MVIGHLPLVICCCNKSPTHMHMFVMTCSRGIFAHQKNAETKSFQFCECVHHNVHATRACHLSLHFQPHNLSCCGQHRGITNAALPVWFACWLHSQTRASILHHHTSSLHWKHTSISSSSSSVCKRRAMLAGLIVKGDVRQQALMLSRTCPHRWCCL